jgi:glucokinase
MSLTIGIDVGGTKIAAGVVDAEGTIIAQVRCPTPVADARVLTDAVVRVVAELTAVYPAAAIGVGAAGFVSHTRTHVLFAPHLPWRDEPVAEQVAARSGLPVVVENDANAAAWAEARLGAGRGEQHIIFIGVGTGIGSGLVLGGQLYRGRWGIAGEVGHFQVVPGGRPCTCGNCGCWEQYASGSALVAEARDLAAKDPELADPLLRRGDGTPDGITGLQVTAAAAEGDPIALRCFEIVGRWLGAGLADLAAVLDPGRFVIGGGVSEAGELLLAPARAAFEGGLTGRGRRPVAGIAAAELPEAGLVGAASLARSQLSG